MGNHPDDPYLAGASAARSAIEAGVPRWIATAADDISGQFDEQIHRDTGLPIAHVGAPKELAGWQAEFARGHNDEIHRAVLSGWIAVDFRPLLMTRDEVQRALIDHSIGTLSLDQPRVEDPSGRFALYLKTPKPRKANPLIATKAEPTIWIAYDHLTRGQEPRFSTYESPVDVTLGREGRVLLTKTKCICLVRDIETTQVLNRYVIC